MTKKITKYNKNSAIRGALRRAFARAPVVQEVMQASRREVPRFNKDGSRHKKNYVQRQCEVCLNWVSTSKMAVDHKEPVVSVENGFQDWNEFIDRLWCEKDNLQRICHECHDKKTKEERISRLLKQYMQELDQIEKDIEACSSSKFSDETIKLYNKLLSKYVAKKKTIDLQPVVQRAQDIKNLIKNKEKK